MTAPGDVGDLPQEGAIEGGLLHETQALLQLAQGLVFLSQGLLQLYHLRGTAFSWRRRWGGQGLEMSLPDQAFLTYLPIPPWPGMPCPAYFSGQLLLTQYPSPEFLPCNDLMSYILPLYLSYILLLYLYPRPLRAGAVLTVCGHPCLAMVAAGRRPHFSLGLESQRPDLATPAQCLALLVGFPSEIWKESKACSGREARDECP